MRAVLESDRLFYLLVGLAMVAIFVVGLVVLAWQRPLERWALLPFVVGFLVFVAVYALSYAITRVESEGR